jgi:hypothetical protein
VKVLIRPATLESLVPEPTDDWDPELELSRLAHEPLQSEQMKRLQRRVYADKARANAILRASKQLEGFRGLAVWFSNGCDAESCTDGWGQLFLVAGFQEDDSACVNQMQSANSALSAFMAEFAAELRKTVLHNITDVGPGSKISSDFHSDPIAWFRSVGATVSDSRRLTSLYRVRNTIIYHEPKVGLESIATIGYPIFISAER